MIHGDEFLYTALVVPNMRFRTKIKIRIAYLMVLFRIDFKMFINTDDYFAYILFQVFVKKRIYMCVSLIL